MAAVGGVTSGSETVIGPAARLGLPTVSVAAPAARARVTLPFFVNPPIVTVNTLSCASGVNDITLPPCSAPPIWIADAENPTTGSDQVNVNVIGSVNGIGNAPVGEAIVTLGGVPSATRVAGNAEFGFPAASVAAPAGIATVMSPTFVNPPTETVNTRFCASGVNDSTFPPCSVPPS
jgi:hypothetical protein